MVELRNVGNEGVDDVQAVLRSSNPLFSVTDSVGTFGEIPACSTRTNSLDPFGIRVDASIPLETPVLCSLFVTGTGYVDTLRFTVVVGQIRTMDPIPDGPRQPPLYWSYDDVDTYYPEHPEFSWVEIRGLGTQLTLTDDQTANVSLPSGLTWQFYGQQFTEISICGNGWVAPGYTTISAYTNSGLPTTSVPGFVALCWDDLYPPYGNSVWYYHDAANNRFIVEYDSVHYYAQRDQWDKYELVIYDSTVRTPTGDNVLLVQYLTANAYSSVTAGIQDPGQTIAIQCLYDNAYHRGTAPLAAGRVIKYTTVSPTVGIAERPDLRGVHRTLVASPNPFRDRVSFSLGSAQPGLSDLRIYDNSGRLVRTLTGTPVWDGRSDTGLRVAPGIYFCRAGTGTERTETKLVLTR